VGSLERRLKALEGSLGKNECPVCSHDPQVPITDYEVVWEDNSEEDLEGPVKEPERCDRCGRQLDFVVVWDDLILDREQEV